MCVRPKTQVWLDLEFGISILCKCYALLAYIAYQEIKYSDLLHLIMIMWIQPGAFFQMGDMQACDFCRTKTKSKSVLSTSDFYGGQWSNL